MSLDWRENTWQSVVQAATNGDNFVNESFIVGISAHVANLDRAIQNPVFLAQVSNNALHMNAAVSNVSGHDCLFSLQLLSSAFKGRDRQKCTNFFQVQLNQKASIDHQYIVTFFNILQQSRVSYYFHVANSSSVSYGDETN